MSYFYQKVKYFITTGFRLNTVIFFKARYLITRSGPKYCYYILYIEFYLVKTLVVVAVVVFVVVVVASVVVEDVVEDNVVEDFDLKITKITFKLNDTSSF